MDGCCSILDMVNYGYNLSVKHMSTLSDKVRGGEVLKVVSETMVSRLILGDLRRRQGYTQFH